jgi:mono/diheme cytochrome c family protein
MASRSNGKGCSQCGGSHNGNGGGKGKSSWKWWLAGAAVVWVLTQGAASNNGGHSDYKSPSEQTQTTKKCDPKALLQLGCTP